VRGAGSKEAGGAGQQAGREAWCHNGIALSTHATIDAPGHRWLAARLRHTNLLVWLLRAK
jgi:hypothetical protein